MLQITNTVTTKDGQVVIGNVTYAINYSIINNELNSIQCAISSMSDNQFEQIGFIRKEHGRLNTDFLDRVAPIEHLTVFENIVKEVEADLLAETKKKQ
ncbi:hypothetical protein CLV62_104153 [Dysgonomonas alginatilytica]|uniref:Uncharacterized protein n=1 Tax=Dysgonomonas alginatilytica TaxID=1605892 RepID=A0A2V3PYM5_9BACT|nr:hypothetical protein [Dysgonomonas alginatilytica]PXV66892.1 hypothetical protein CLV62_104153 [Dysgonomonas alginatilytica]